MGHDKLRKFAENETFGCLLQPSAQDLLADGYFNLRDHEVKGHWNEKMFAKAQPIVLELGCGKGEYTIDLAQRNPQFNYIGVDIKGARLWKGAKYATEHSLGNVAFLRTRIEFITAFFAPGEVSEIWLTFSDPQMKSENSRLSSPLFLDRYRSFLRPGGIVHLKTDSRFLHEYTKAVCAANSLTLLACTSDLYGTPREELYTAGPGKSPAPLTSSLRRNASLADLSQSSESLFAGSGDLSEAKPASAVDAIYEVQTFYERMFLQQGYKITYLSFVIDHEGEYVHPEFDEEYWRGVEGPRRSFDHQPTKGHKPE